MNHRKDGHDHDGKVCSAGRANEIAQVFLCDSSLELVKTVDFPVFLEKIGAKREDLLSKSLERSLKKRDDLLSKSFVRSLTHVL